MLSGLPLPAPELRVLGALMEKELLTPDLYPLSLNALQSAANQRSSRDPVLDLTESDLRSALDALEQLGLAAPARAGLASGNSRVPRFENHARSVLQLRRDEFALLCLLLLRGPQTPGELRSRADRLFSFEDLDAVNATLARLAAPGTAEEPRPLVAQLPRQPGSREVRFTHLLGDPAPPTTAVTSTSAAPESAPTFAQLAAALHDLTTRVGELERRLSGQITPTPSSPQAPSEP